MYTRETKFSMYTRETENLNDQMWLSRVLIKDNIAPIPSKCEKIIRQIHSSFQYFGKNNTIFNYRNLVSRKY
jgi:hypothetical protein